MKRITDMTTIGLLAITLLAGQAIAQVPDDPISQDAFAAFKRIEPGALDTLALLCESIEGNRIGWNASHILNAYVLMYEATGDAAYMDIMPRYADRIFYNRADRWGITDELRGRVVKGWTSRKYQTGDKTSCWLGHAASTLIPIVRWSYYVKQDPALAEKYGEKADEYVRQAAETLLDFDTDWREGPGEDVGHYLGLYDPKYAKSSHEPGGIQDQPLPFNYHSLAGQLSIWLYLTTGQEVFKDRAAKIATFLKSNLREEDDTYAWPYAVYRKDKSYEDTGHASLTMALPLEASAAGIVFDEADVDRVVNRFLAWCPEGTQTMPTYIDGTGDDGKDHNMTRWAILTRYDERVRDRAYAYMKARWDEPSGAQFRYLEGAAYLIAAVHADTRYPSLSAEQSVNLSVSDEMSESISKVVQH